MTECSGTTSGFYSSFFDVPVLVIGQKISTVVMYQKVNRKPDEPKTANAFWLLTSSLNCVDVQNQQ